MARRLLLTAALFAIAAAASAASWRLHAQAHRCEECRPIIVGPVSVEPAP